MFADMNKITLSILTLTAVIGLMWAAPVFAAEENTTAEPAIVAPAAEEAAPAETVPAEIPAPAEINAVTPEKQEVSEVKDIDQLQKMRQEAELLKLQAEIEKSRAEVEKARAEAEKAKTEALEAKGDCVKPEKEEDEAGYHKHDGFFLRMTPGFGVGGFKVSGNVTDSDGLIVKNPSDKGAVGTFSLLLGGEVSDNLTIHADFWSYSTMGEHGQDLYTGITTGGVGLGLTYYFMPHNLYLSGTLSPAFTALSVIRDLNNDTSHKTHMAYGLNASLTFGKEWWVSKNWGLGIAVRGEYGFAQNDDFDISNGAGVLLFTATYQ